MGTLYQPEGLPSPEEITKRYDRAFSILDSVVASIPFENWDESSINPGWSQRDILDHLIWGQMVIARWAEGEPLPGPHAQDWTVGASGAELAALWVRCREATRSVITESALRLIENTALFGRISLGQFLWFFPSDGVLHAWDLSMGAHRACGTAVIDIPHDLAAELLELGESYEDMLRRPGVLGPRVEVSEDEDVVTRWLAFAGRSPKL